GRAVLDGPGRMVDQGGRVLAATADGAEPSSDRPRRITWRDMVIVRFSERTVDGRTRQEIDEAWFHGGVRLRQGTSDDEEFVHCDELRVDMTDLGGRVAPSEAVAIGNVHARQEGRDIRADRGVLQFEPHRSRPGEPLEMRPARFDALGNVRVADPDADEPLEATADRIVSDLVQRNAVLYGGEKQAHWAEMRQGANRLRGREIHLYQVPDLRGSGRELEVRTEGYGTLDFRTRRGLDGRDLASARPVRIAWSRSMSYQGDRDTAEFFGDVELDSGPDHMAAEAMRVRFERTEARGDAAPEAPDEGDEDALALSMENYSKRRIAMIRAEGSDPAERNVLLRRRQTDEAGRLLRRMQLRSTDLQYDATLARVIITSWGKMVAEDYRPPERDAPDEGGLVAADVQRPSQTVIEWQAADARDREGDRGPACYMELLQKRRQATVHGDVTLRHRSGRKIVRAASLRVPEWGELPPGRRMDLRCGHAVVWFAEPDAAGDDDGEAPALGRFERFSAARRVNFQYGPWQILGERVLYSRTEDVATAWGYRKGATPADAQVVHEDVETGRSQTWSSPKVQVFPRTERVVTEGGTGTFGR
ncbi:MAG: LptA/OstA family protein, partial [Planctomycetota bacterium]